jgi:hypothetical protein
MGWREGVKGLLAMMAKVVAMFHALGVLKFINVYI